VIDASVIEGYCVICHEPVPEVDGVTAELQHEAKAVMLVRMCAECTADFERWRAAERAAEQQARARLS
jgi:hypothetical protein